MQFFLQNLLPAEKNLTHMHADFADLFDSGRLQVYSHPHVDLQLAAGENL